MTHFLFKLAAAAAIIAGTGTLAAAPLIVIDARGGGLKPGMRIDGAKPLQLKEGERLTVIGLDGRTQTLRGPFSGPPAHGAAAASDPRAALAALIATRAARTSSVGVVRGGADAPALPDPWLIDVSGSGERCLRAGSQPVWWRPMAGAADVLTVMPIDRSWSAAVRWPAGQQRFSPPELGRSDGPAVLIFRDAGEDHVVRINEVPADLPNPFVLVSWMLEKGCVQQGDALLRQLQREQQPAATTAPPAPLHTGR